mmetsp:Transcript_6327/g.16084  ORF Transcript_6327/g.16084 Transcript_6327/m.16084 type:complete len:428 (+) Transcript_6327:130-1413(+)
MAQMFNCRRHLRWEEEGGRDTAQGNGSGATLPAHRAPGAMPRSSRSRACPPSPFHCPARCPGYALHGASAAWVSDGRQPCGRAVMGHSRAAASILVVSFKSSHEPLRTRTYHWIFMGSPGKLCIIGSDADSEVLRYSDWMLDHFLGTFSAAAPTTARMFSTASSVAKEVLATLMLRHDPPLLNMYVAPSAFSTCADQSLVARFTGIGCFFFLKKDLPRYLGSDGRMRSSARKRSYWLHSARFASCGSYLVFSLDSPITLVTPAFFSSARRFFAAFWPSPSRSFTIKHTSGSSSFHRECGRSSRTGLSFRLTAGVVRSEMMRYTSSSSSSSSPADASFCLPVNLASASTAFVTCATSSVPPLLLGLRPPILCGSTQPLDSRRADRAPSPDRRRAGAGCGGTKALDGAQLLECLTRGACASFSLRRLEW